MNRILDIQNLKISFSTITGQIAAVRGIDLTVDKGEAVGIVGESGSGKSVTAHAIMRLLNEASVCITEGRILFDNRDLTLVSQKEMQHIRGKEISMIFQDAMNCLNPTMKIGRQLEEVFIKHLKLNHTDALSRCKYLLDSVGIDMPQRRMKQYPHELSGGMRQRVIIAMAIACNPRLIIADEPTTAVDVTNQAQIIGILKELQRKKETSILLITHNFGIISGLCSRIAVMYAGKIVETGSAEDIFYEPSHPYTNGLLKSVQRNTGYSGHELAVIPGQPPNITEIPSGCPFWPRCREAMKICVRDEPPVVEISKNHLVQCWIHLKNKGVLPGE